MVMAIQGSAGMYSLVFPSQKRVSHVQAGERTGIQSQRSLAQTSRPHPKLPKTSASKPLTSPTTSINNAFIQKTTPS